MRSEYLPALVPYVVDGEAWRSPIHWLGKDTPVFYPYSLISYIYWNKHPIPFGPDCTVVFGDSGGYSLVTQQTKKLDPVDVIKWQIEKCTRGVILDVPPYRPKGGIQFRGSAAEWWAESLARTQRNITSALPLYADRGFENPDTRFSWWGVVQGETVEQMTEWHGRVSELYAFDDVDEGWALAPKPSTDRLSCTRYLRFARDNNLRNIHFLQVTAERAVALIMALSQIAGNIDLVTYDSASAGRCAINRSAIIPDGIGMSYITEKRSAGGLQVEEFMQKCACPACQYFRKDYPLTNREYPHYILLHNHITMVESFGRMHELAEDDPERLLRWAAGLRYGEVLREWSKSPAARAKRQSCTPRLADRV